MSEATGPNLPEGTDGLVAAAGRSSEEGLQLAGRVEEACFADLMRTLVQNKETALLTLSRDGITKTTYVQDGRIVFATSSDRDERLGECMLCDGMITIEQYEQSVKLLRPGKRQGTILVELGYITPAELVRGVKSQVETIVLSLFRWRSGDYNIDIRPIDTRDIITLNISTENLMFTGIKRGAGWSQVLRGLGGTLETVLGRAQDADTRLYKIDLTDDENHVYSLANGRLSVAQTCSMSYLSNFDTCVSLWGLVCCGILGIVSSRDAESLFREQVAEFETLEIRDHVESFNKGLRACCERVATAAPGRERELLAQALAEVLDEHYDVLRDVGLGRGDVDPDLIVENVAAIDPGRRRRAVEKALSDLLVAFLLRIRLDVSPDLERELARQVSARGAR